MSQNSIEFSCSNCGSNNFKVPTDPKPDDIIICGGCGGQEKYGVLKRSAIKQAEKLVSDKLMNMFK